MRSTTTILTLLFFLGISYSLQAQDTVQVSLEEFIRKGIENSGKVSYERQKISFAVNRIRKANSKRFIPKFELNTQHGVVPGVKSNTNLPEDQFYLDPNLENDWEDIGLFTRARVDAVQPLFTWGALKNAVNAAESAATAAKERFESQKADMTIKLFELYHSYVLTLEVNRLLDEARKKINRIEEQINEKKDSEDSDIDESEVFKFEIFKSRFAIQAAELQENSKYIRNVWDYVLQADSGRVYEPNVQFMDPVTPPLKELDHYRLHAINARPEVKAIEAGIDAASYGLKATRAQRLPTLFLGITGSYANTPNRPRQSNPFIINNTNYASAAIGFGFRQNLDFLSIKADISRSKIQKRQAKYLKDAAVDGINLEVSEKYKEASLSKVKIDRIDEALVTAKKWLRQEQLDYDFGIGETKDLLDAMKEELELRVELKRQIFDFNKNMAELHRASGFELSVLKMNEQQ